jgi:fumarate reductase flavoprotein subunit
MVSTTGVRSDGAEQRSKTVIITTGGFGKSPGMRAKYFPSVEQHGDIVYSGHNFTPFILGDGIDLGEAVGAAIIGYLIDEQNITDVRQAV